MITTNVRNKLKQLKKKNQQKQGINVTDDNTIQEVSGASGAGRGVILIGGIWCFYIY